MQIDTRSQGRLQSFDGTADGVAQAFDSCVAPGRAVVSITTTGQMVQAQRKGGGTWRLRVVDVVTTRGGMESRRSGNIDERAARAALAAYVGGDPSWEAHLTTKRGVAGRSPALLIPLTFVVATVLALLVMQLTGTLDGFESRYIPNLVVGVGLVSGVTVYADIFMRRFRPPIATALGRRLGVTVVEADSFGWFSRPGGWVTEGGGAMSTVKATCADFIVIIVGFVVPIAAFASAVVLLADRFLA